MSLDLLKTITNETRDAKKDAEREILDGIKDAYAKVIIARSVPGWGESETALETIKQADATIEAATDGLSAATKQRVVDTGKAMARVSVAKQLLEAVNSNDAMANRRALENLFVRLLYDGLDGKNFVRLPYKNDKDEEITLEGLQKATVMVGGKEFSRGSEVIFGRGDFVQRDEETGQLSVTVLHAPGFQGSKLVQALTICLQKAGKRLGDLYKEFKKERDQSRERFANRNANVGTFENKPMADGLNGVTGKEE